MRLGIQLIVDNLRTENELTDKGFSRRLNQACDSHPHVPAYGQGRQEWVKNQLKVSSEAVRKYFQGEARPRPDKMRQLARVLEVDEAWLALGIAPDMQPSERRVRNAQVDGAVNVCMGLLQMNGGHCALPSDTDPRAAFVDFYAIIRGIQLAFHVSLAKHVSDGQYKFIIPKEYPECAVVGAVHVNPMRVQFLTLGFAAIDRHKNRKGGYYELVVSKRDSKYYTGRDELPVIKDFHSF